PHQRERVECLRFQIVRVRGGEPAHRGGIERVPPLLGAVTVEHLHRLEVAPLPGCPRLPAAGLGRRCQPAEDRACRVEALLVPHGMVRVIASPQYASANPGSARWASRNAAAASSYSKLWSSNTPRMKARWAGLAPELGKEMVPSLAAACPASGLARDSASTAVRLKPSTGRTERPGRRRLRARARATARRMLPRHGMRSTIPHGADPRQVIMLRRAGLAPLRPCPAPQAVLGQSGGNWFPMA